jgi:glycosyltransferase involved in cell wall biosynthesis
LLFLQIAASQIKQNPQLHFSILGAGLTDHLTLEIQQFLRVNQLQHKINILKWGDNETSKRFLNSIDVFVMTSVFEGLPFSLIEAMSLGIPCVVSKVDGNTDVIHNNENGYSCLSLAEFENKISSLIDSEDLRRKFGQAGYRYVKNTHDIQKNITQLEKLYCSLYYNDHVFDINKSRLGYDVQLKVSPVI